MATKTDGVIGGDDSKMENGKEEELRLISARSARGYFETYNEKIWYAPVNASQNLPVQGLLISLLCAKLLRLLDAPNILIRGKFNFKLF